MNPLYMQLYETQCHIQICTHHAMVEGEDSYIPPMMNVIPSDDGVAMVFHPDARKGIVGDLIVLIYALQGIGHKNG